MLRKRVWGNILRLFPENAKKEEVIVKDAVRPFEDIPGPRALPLVGSTWKYILPIRDAYDPERLHHAARQKFERYGPLVRETLPDGTGLISVFDPDDVKSFLKQTMSQPDRRSHLALNKYRLDRPHMYSSAGLLPSNGNEWLKLRKASQAVFGKPEAVLGHLPDVDQVLKDFVSSLRRKRSQQNTVENLLDHIKLMNLEALLVVVLDQRLGSLSDHPPAECEALMRAGGRSTRAILKTDNGPLQLYRYFDTPLYKELVDSQDFIHSVAKKYYDHKNRALAAEGGAGEAAGPQKRPSILEQLIRSSALGEREVVGLVCDALMAGVDTTSFSLAFTLYHLSRNTEAQERLALEARTLLLSSGGSVTAQVLAGARYTTAVVKESMRLHPISIGIGRVNSSKPIVIRNYRIPAGTTIVSMNQHIGRNPTYFENPDQFLPDRFLGDGSSRGRGMHHSHALLPFGQGSRSCIAQNIARQTIHTALLHLVSNFELTWLGGVLDCKVRLINEPDGPLALALADRLPTTR